MHLDREGAGDHSSPPAARKLADRADSNSKWINELDTPGRPHSPGTGDDSDGCDQMLFPTRSSSFQARRGSRVRGSWRPSCHGHTPNEEGPAVGLSNFPVSRHHVMAMPLNPPGEYSGTFNFRLSLRTLFASWPPASLECSLLQASSSTRSPWAVAAKTKAPWLRLWFEDLRGGEFLCQT